MYKSNRLSPITAIGVGDFCFNLPAETEILGSTGSACKKKNLNRDCRLMRTKSAALKSVVVKRSGSCVNHTSCYFGDKTVG